MVYFGIICFEIPAKPLRLVLI